MTRLSRFTDIVRCLNHACGTGWHWEITEVEQRGALLRFELVAEYPDGTLRPTGVTASGEHLSEAARVIGRLHPHIIEQLSDQDWGRAEVEERTEGMDFLARRLLRRARARHDDADIADCNMLRRLLRQVAEAVRVDTHFLDDPLNDRLERIDASVQADSQPDRR